MTEAFIQYVWQHQMLTGTLLTTEGVPISVINQGRRNVDAGPDFLDARLQIGSTQWVGNVEIHLRASDWFAHGHDKDKAYNNVILHVVLENNAIATCENGHALVTADISSNIPTAVTERYESLTLSNLAATVGCLPLIKEVPQFICNSYLQRLLVERIERKSVDIRRLLSDSKGSWEDCCFWVVARYFGGTTNAFACEMLAKSIPLQLVSKLKDSRFRVEALFMGQAGFLEHEFVDDFPQALKKEYEYLRRAYKLVPMKEQLWKFFRLRPHSFPTVRVSQLATLAFESTHLFSKLLEATDAERLRALFDCEASDYWSSHYRFDQPSKAVLSKRVGTNLVDRLIINAWAPLLFEYASVCDKQPLKERAIAILETLPAEKNSVVAQWKGHLKPDNAAHSQALIQLYNEYCTQRACLNCAIGYYLIKHSSPKDAQSLSDTQTKI